MSATVHGLYGRRAECETLGQLIEEVQAGHHAVLVLRGHSGEGKTALLDHLADRAAQHGRVVRVAGVEAEMELPYAGLQQLCATMLDQLDALPVPQRDALRVTFGLAEGALAGGFGLPAAQPLASRIEQGFVRRLRPLPAQARQFLLVAAAEPIGDPTLLRRAAAKLGLADDAATPAEAAGLIEIGTRVRFRHPLVRSAVYRAATLPERRRVHQVLADATDAVADPDRRAWHLAAAAPAPDAAVAEELERSAERAQARGGVAAAAAFLERATELTPDPARRGARALAAAQAKFDAGDIDTTRELLATAEMSALDGLQRARVERLRAQLAFAGSRGRDAPPLLLGAAERLSELATSRRPHCHSTG